jgi:hypothetical protein
MYHECDCPNPCNRYTDPRGCKWHKPDVRSLLLPWQPLACCRQLSLAHCCRTSRQRKQPACAAVCWQRAPQLAPSLAAWSHRAAWLPGCLAGWPSPARRAQPCHLCLKQAPPAAPPTCRAARRTTTVLASPAGCSAPCAWSCPRSSCCARWAGCQGFQTCHCQGRAARAGTSWTCTRPRRSTWPPPPPPTTINHHQPPPATTTNHHQPPTTTTTNTRAGQQPPGPGQGNAQEPAAVRHQQRGPHRSQAGQVRRQAASPARQR